MNSLMLSHNSHISKPAVFMAKFELTDEIIEELKPSRTQEEFYDAGFSAGGSFGIRLGSGGSKAFFLIYSLHGRRKRITLGRYPLLTVAGARTKAIELLRAVAEGRDPAAELRHYRAAADVGELVELYLRRQQERGLKTSTLREYRRILEREVLPLWADRKAADIRADEVAHLLDIIAVERSSPVMANRARAVLNRLFSFAHERRIVPENPVREVSLPAEEGSHIYPLEFVELTTIWRALNALEDLQISALFKLLLFTGQRPGDVMSIRWADLRLDKWIVSEGHEIFLVPQAFRALEKLRDSPYGGEEYVFETGPGRPRAYIRRAARRINIGLNLSRPFSPIDFRRSMDHRLAELGVRPDVTDRILGRKISPKQPGADVAYDYTADVRSALILWARRVAPPQPPSRPVARGKVIQLADFRKRSE